MLLIVAFVLACSSSECGAQGPGSPVGPDVQAFMALKAQPQPAGRLRDRVRDARLADQPRKRLSFREDPLLTWSERHALQGR